MPACSRNGVPPSFDEDEDALVIKVGHSPTDYHMKSAVYPTAGQPGPRAGDHQTTDAMESGIGKQLTSGHV
jgi:hypothetical protein